ncbi:GH36 C-terminal domain-containing protein [Lactococcus termiticola]|uniref:Alpha-galactosidase n=1 Tax=Lactococcus termiticola TaxID=2169526 RepID=A0A2R5HDT0_9LACT|nr:GH36 C-terminal domain-containing protein [Lactococcus termiticola]GBG95966.1 alpha-galactosidase [Lactococcus termiticola]
MAIIVDEKNRLFNLETEHSIYQMKVGAFEHLLHLYYGTKIPPEDTGYLLTCPFETASSIWQFVAKDQSESLLNMVLTDVEGNSPYNYVKLQGLDPEAIYQIDGAESYRGSLLMRAGLRLPQSIGDYPAYQFHIKKV